jgi:hypothetical protein
MPMPIVALKQRCPRFSCVVLMTTLFSGDAAHRYSDWQGDIKWQLLLFIVAFSPANIVKFTNEIKRCAIAVDVC